MKEFIDKLIERLEEKRSKYEELADGSNFDGWAQEEKIYLAKEEECENIIEIVNLLAEEYKGGWIPCSERLREDGETVLVQDFEEHYEILNCETKYGVKGFSNGWWASANNYIAWMPLPAPYTEGE